MTRRRELVASLAFVLMLLGSCTKQTLASDHTGSPTSGATAVQLPGSPEALPVTDLAGYRSLLAGLDGSPVLVNVWASWCGPCQDEAPLLSAAAAAHPNVRFVGVDIQDSRDGAVGFIRRFALPYPSLFNPSADIRDGLGLPGQPDTLFYDANGDLQSQILGPLDQDSLDQGLAKITS